MLPLTLEQRQLLAQAQRRAEFMSQAYFLLTPAWVSLVLLAGSALIGVLWLESLLVVIGAALLMLLGILASMKAGRLQQDLTKGMAAVYVGPVTLKAVPRRGAGGRRYYALFNDVHGSHRVPIDPPTAERIQTALDTISDAAFVVHYAHRASHYFSIDLLVQSTKAW